jgi:hypothetical protein
MALWAVDSHIHFHKCFTEVLFFESCFKNISSINHSVIKNGILFFTEGKNEDSFNYLRTLKKIQNPKTKETFSFDEIENGNAIKISTNKNDVRIIILPGFQIVTKENLEVLSLGTKTRLLDGDAIESTIDKVISLGGIPVLPWGFGKWYGNRGKKVDEIIMKRIPNLLLGDNGGRSSMLPYPTQFNLAEANGMKILPGSDPLPFPQEAKRPMSFGFLAKINFDEKKPWESVKKSLLDENLKIEKFGNLTSPFAFVKTQIAMQIKKRNKT